MIGGLQGKNRDLNNKYLKKKNLKELVANIWEYIGGFRKLKLDLQKFRKLNCPLTSWTMISQVDFCDFAACEIVFQLGVVVFQWP